MPRLPIVGSDDGDWGDILNEFLDVEHNADGTLDTSGTLGSYAPLASPTFTGTVTVPTPSNATDAVTKAYVDGLDGDNVKLTGNQTVAGEKTFSNDLVVDQGAGGKVSLISSSGMNVAVFDDASDTNPTVALNSSTGIAFGDGTSIDTVISRTGANNLGFGGALLSGVDDPVAATDAATKGYVDSLPTLEHMTGFYGSRVGMNKWRLSTRDLKHIVCWGDSVTQGLAVDGKTRSYVTGLRDIIRNEFNEEVQEGIQPMYWATGGTPVRYTTSGGWTSISGQSASNLTPHGSNGSLLRSTNTTLRTITWTRPSDVTCTKFYVLWVDDSTVTSGAYWSYSVDGGSTWTEVATASPGTPVLNYTEVVLDEADWDPSTIMLRNANAAGTTYTNSPCFAGLDIRHSDYGWVIHNYGQSGASLQRPVALNSCGAVSTDRAGEWSTWFEEIQPELVIMEFSNDMADYDETRMDNAVEEAVSTLDVYADIVSYGFPDQVRLTGPGVTYQAVVRQKIKDKVLEYNGIAVEMQERWTSVQNSKDLGFMPDVLATIHPTELGDKDIASAIGRLLRSYG